MARPILFLLFAASLPTRPSAAQDGSSEEVPLVTGTYALTGARVVQAPDRVLERGTVVVRDGLIAAVGADVAIPFDAQRIAADSLVVYAGFIDGLSHAGIPKPEEEERPDIDEPANPPPDLAGIQPSRAAADLLKPGDKSVDALRELGFTVAHVVPRGGMLPGKGALVVLAGETPSAMVFRGDAALFAQFEGARRQYPATPMGVMAKWRDLYRGAEQRRQAAEAYQRAPEGRARPDLSPVYAGFFPVLSGEQPVFFFTESTLETRRALELHRDLGFPLVLAGLQGAFDAVETLQSAQLPLFLTLGLPEAPGEEEADSAATAPLAGDSLAADPSKQRAVTPAAPGSFFQRDYRTRSYEDVEGEKDYLEARQTRERARYDSTAALLQGAGLRFGLASLGVKPKDIRPNLRRMVAAGLSEEAALAALTTDAATLLGLERQLGTVDAGKMANLVVTDGPYFDEETAVRYVFVEGQLFEYEAKSPRRGGTPADPAGTWSFTVASPDGDVTGEIVLTGSPDDLSGTLTSSMTGPVELDDVELDGSTLTFSFNTDQFGRIEAEVVLEDDSFEGTLDVTASGDVVSIEAMRSRPGS